MLEIQPLDVWFVDVCGCLWDPPRGTTEEPKQIITNYNKFMPPVSLSALSTATPQPRVAHG